MFVSFIHPPRDNNMSSPPPTLDLKCVGSTGDAFCKTIQEYDDGQPPAKRIRIGQSGNSSNLFREAQFSGDGTTVVTHSEDECLRTFVLPPDLLDRSDEDPANLEVYDNVQSPTNTLCYALYPAFDLANPSTTLALSASKDVPLTLRNVLHYQTLHASYLLTDRITEAFITPHSLTWTGTGGSNATHFLAGSRDRIAVFDASRDGEGPMTVHKTASSRKAQKRYAAQEINGCKGIVSAMHISPDGVLAAGTLSRNLGLFEHGGLGECATAFSLSSPDRKSEAANGGIGTGIMSLRWSPCAKYLLIAERQSDSVHVYDVRVTHRRVGWLSGRRAETTQKLGMDVVPTENGFEVWAGGTDGCVRMWENAGSLEGAQVPDREIKLHDGKCKLKNRLELLQVLIPPSSNLQYHLASWRGSACDVLWSEKFKCQN